MEQGTSINVKIDTAQIEVDDVVEYRDEDS